MTIEQEVAARIVHQERVAKILSRTGGEAMAVDHYDLREAMRVSVLRVLDEAAEENGVPKMSDAELPFLFKTIDAIAERCWIEGLPK